MSEKAESEREILSSAELSVAVSPPFSIRRKNRPVCSFSSGVRLCRGLMAKGRPPYGRGVSEQGELPPASAPPDALQLHSLLSSWYSSSWFWILFYSLFFFILCVD